MFSGLDFVTLKKQFKIFENAFVLTVRLDEFNLGFFLVSSQDVIGLSFQPNSAVCIDCEFQKLKRFTFGHNVKQAALVTIAIETLIWVGSVADTSIFVNPHLNGLVGISAKSDLFLSASLFHIFSSFVLVVCNGFSIMRCQNQRHYVALWLIDWLQLFEYENSFIRSIHQ